MAGMGRKHSKLGLAEFYCFRFLCSGDDRI